MNYEEFLKLAGENLTEKLADKGYEVAVGIKQVDKLQDEAYKGLSVRLGCENTGIVLNLQDLYADCEKGEDMEEAFSGLAGYILRCMDQIPKFREEDFTDYNRVREHLMLELVSTKDNREMLEKVPHTEVQDLSIVYRITVGEPRSVTGSVLLTNQHLEMFGIDRHTLHKDALKNAAEKYPADICPLTAKIFELRGGKEPEEVVDYPEMMEMYFAASNNAYLGASCIVYPGFLEEAGEKFGRSFFIIPSSLHEVLLLPEHEGQDVQAMAEIIREVNKTLDPKDKLTDSLYRYDKDLKVFEKVDSEDPNRDRNRNNIRER